jgi:menaquinone-dependent protoporphyrinogen IX oxidase
MKVLIVCASKYGSTLETGKWLAERLGGDSLVEKAESMMDPSDADLVILGSGIYRHHVLPSLEEYVNRFKDVLKDKKTVVFGVAMDTRGVFVRGKVHGGWDYILPVIRSLPKPPIHAGLLGGEINPDKLDAKDTEGLKQFYNMLYGCETPIPYKTLMDKNDVWGFAEKILERLERPI